MGNGREGKGREGKTILFVFVTLHAAIFPMMRAYLCISGNK